MFSTSAYFDDGYSWAMTNHRDYWPDVINRLISAIDPEALFITYASVEFLHVRKRGFSMYAKNWRVCPTVLAYIGRSYLTMMPAHLLSPLCFQTNIDQPGIIREFGPCIIT